MKINNNESKQRFSLYTHQSTIDKAVDFAKKRNCGTSDFIAEAIEFYSGFLSNQNDTSFLPDAVADSMTKVMDPFTRKQGTLLFKIAVELTVSPSRSTSAITRPSIPNGSHSRCNVAASPVPPLPKRKL